MITNYLLDKVEPSRSVTLLARTKELQKTDPSIINMTGGEPDFPTPEAVCQEVYKELAAGHTHYSDSKGDIELRQRISKKLLEENGASFTADQILITPGAKYAIYLTVQALINPGDEVIWLTPGWVSYPSIVTLCGGNPVAVHLDYDQDYALTEELLEAAASDKTRMLIINYPNNPTGKILSDSDLAVLKAFMLRHPDVLLLSDEIYEKIIYDANVVKSPAADPDLANRVIIVNGFSKASAMTGWRIGYLACCTELYSKIIKIFQHSMSCVSGFIQRGALVALDLPEETEMMRAAYERRRNILLDVLADAPGIELKAPEGSFYAWIRFKSEQDPQDICGRLLTEAKIAGIPGDAYGEEKYPLIRFCFAADEATVAEMAKRLKAWAENNLK